MMNNIFIAVNPVRSFQSLCRLLDYADIRKDC